MSDFVADGRRRTLPKTGVHGEKVQTKPAFEESFGRGEEIICGVKRTPVKIAVAGAGYGRKVALPVYRDIEEFEPVACWSRTPERAVKLANEFGLSLGTSDFDELLDFPGLEAVHLATPVVTHLPLARAVADRGLHLLCEKPLAENLDNARQIAGAVRSAGVVGAVVYSLRM